MKRTIRILLIEDSQEDAELLLAEIENGGYGVTHLRVDTAKSTMDALTTGQWDMVISDYNMPQFNGMAAIEIVKMHAPDLPILIISGDMGEAIAVATMRAGANDYLMKGNLSRLAPAIDRELRDYKVRIDARLAQTRLAENEIRFRTLASNIPGMVFQLSSDPSGALKFSYVSDGSKRLLDASPQAFLQDSARFFDKLADQTESGLRSRISAASQSLRSFNWEGCLDCEPGAPVTWVLIRLNPHHVGNGVIQWDGIVQDISRRKHAELDLLRSQRQLSALSSHLQKAKEAERTSIAREVHDDIGGNLTAIKIDLLWLINHIGGANPEVWTKLHSLEFLTDRTMEITARIAGNLRPPLLDLGLLAAIEWEAAEFTKRVEIPCVVRCDHDDIALNPELATALFSVFREILTNISKHAGATRVDARLDINETACTLSVTDNGRGFTQTDLLKEKSFGLRGMLERARNLGGYVKFSGSPGIGATVVVCLPLNTNGLPKDNFESTTGALWLE